MILWRYGSFKRCHLKLVFMYTFKRLININFTLNFLRFFDTFKFASRIYSYSAILTTLFLNKPSGLNSISVPLASLADSLSTVLVLVLVKSARPGSVNGCAWPNVDMLACRPV